MALLITSLSHAEQDSLTVTSESLRPLSSALCLQQLGVHMCAGMHMCAFDSHAGSMQHLQSLNAWQKPAISNLAQMLYQYIAEVLLLIFFQSSPSGSTLHQSSVGIMDDCMFRQYIMDNRSTALLLRLTMVLRAA